MAFEDKKNQLKDSLYKPEIKSRRIQKSFTLKEEVANELVRKAKEEELTASRYLEKLLREQFNL